MYDDIESYLAAITSPPPIPAPHHESSPDESPTDVSIHSPSPPRPLPSSSTHKPYGGAKLSPLFTFPSFAMDTPQSRGVQSSSSPSPPLSPMDIDGYLASLTPPPQNSISSPSPLLSPMQVDQYLAFMTPPLLNTTSTLPGDDHQQSEPTSPISGRRQSSGKDHSPPPSSPTRASPIDKDDSVRSLSKPPSERDQLPYPSSRPCTPDVDTYEPLSRTDDRPRRSHSQPQPHVEPSGTYEIDTFHESILLGQILDSLQYNAPSTWIDQMSLNTYLALERSRRQVAELTALYVPHEFASFRPDDAVIAQYQRRLPFPAEPERLPISTLIHDGAHFFGVMVYVPRKAAYIFGQHFKKTYVDMHAGRTWNEWRGPEIFNNLCRLHDIPPFDPTVVIGINWAQHGGTECGAECGQTLLVTQTTPLTFQGNGVPCRPPAGCTHGFRMDMLRTVHETASNALFQFCTSSTLPPDKELTAQTFREEWLESNKVHTSLQRPLEALQTAMVRCSSCQAAKTTGRRSVKADKPPRVGPTKLSALRARSLASPDAREQPPQSARTSAMPMDLDEALRSLSVPPVDPPMDIFYPSTPPGSRDDDDYAPPPIRTVKRTVDSDDQPPDHLDTHGTFEADRFMPHNIVALLHTLKFNAPSTWLAQFSVDTYLALQRSRHDLTQLTALYVPLDYTHRPNAEDRRPRHMAITQEQIETYQRQLLLPAHPEELPISTLVHHGVHFFGVMMYVPRKAVYIFGEHINETYVDMNARRTWTRWEGPEILITLCRLHDIPPFDPTVVIGINWEQPGGTECGAECGQTLLQTQTSPLTFQADGVPCRPPAGCTHGFRMNMLRTLHETASNALLQFCTSPTLPPDEQMTVQNLREEWLDSGKLHDTLQRPLQALQRAMALCTRCQTDDAPRRRVNPSILPHQFTSQAKTRPTLRDLRHVYPEFSTARVSQAIQVEVDASVEQPDADQPEDPEDPDEQEVPEASMAHHRTTSLRDTSAGTYRKFPHPFPTPVPPTRALTGRRVPFKPTFDAYDEGPSLLSTRLIKEDYGLFIHPRMYTFIRRTDIEQSLNPNPFPTEWADFGFRVLPDFAQTFDLTDTPWTTGDHLFPRLPRQFEGTAEYPESHPSCLAFSLREINDRVEERNPLLPLVGLWQPSEPRMYVRVDPELDALPELEVEIQLDCDIDSFIAVGRDLPFLENLTLHSLPLHRRKAPLTVNNHVYVEILLPRSEYDIEHRQPMVDGVARAEWWMKRYPLSQIPHLELGSFPKRGAQLLIFFPRLIHRMMYLHYHATNIPYELKQLFYEELLYPAIRQAKPASQHQYFVYSEVMLTHKTGKSSTSLPLDITPEEFTVMCEFMRKKIANDQADRLNRFGSFFFVYTVKGVKGLTKHAIQPGITLSEVIQKAFASFCRHFNALDYDKATMEKGVETFFDLGFTFTGMHPTTPLTGLWKLDFLEAAFSASGYHAGTAHHSNTFDRYGGLQAEMKEEHRRQSHVSGCNAYGLHYQMWRTRDNKVASFTPTEVAENNEAYQGYVERLRHGLSETATNGVNYGVRREFRVGLKALEALIQLEEANDFDPVERIRSSVTWVPSARYSGFLLNRLNALHTVVQQLASFRPRLKNHVTLSGLISFLLQSIMSTPVMVPTFVRKALRELRFGSTIARHGLFFLHDLDLSNVASLGLPISDKQKDRYETIRDADVTLDALAPRLPYSGDADSRTTEMPWRELQHTLKSTPAKIVESWIFPSTLALYIQPAGVDNSIELQAAALFIEFTQSWWSLVNDVNKQQGTQEVSIKTLEEATEFWSLASLWNALNLVQVRPLLRGNKAEVFRERLYTWFRPDDPSKNLEGGWKLFLGTYLTSYRTAVGRLKKIPQPEGVQTAGGIYPEVHRLDDALRHILSLIQCLPDADLRSPCKSDAHTGAMKLVLNPAALTVIPKTAGRRKRTAPPPANKKDAFLFNIHKFGAPIADAAARRRAIILYKRAVRNFAARQRGGKQGNRGRGGRQGRVGRPRGGKTVPQVDAEDEDVPNQSSSEGSTEGSEEQESDRATPDDDEFDGDPEEDMDD